MTERRSLQAVHARIAVGARTFQVETCAEPDGDGFHGFCRDVPGIHVWGADEVEAFSTCKEAASVYIQAALNAGDPLPVGIAEVANPTNPGIRRKSTRQKSVVKNPERAIA